MARPMHGDLAAGLRTAVRQRGSLALFFALLIVAEVLAASESAWLGLIAHAMLIGWLVHRAATAASPRERRLLGALTIAPLIRLLSMSLPIIPLLEPVRPGLVALLVLLGALVAVRRLELSWSAVGLTSRRWWLQLPLGGLGLPLGLIVYGFIGPAVQAPEPADDAIVIAFAGALVLAAVTEEVVFRGLLLSAALQVFGRIAAVVFVTLVYASLQVGHGSLANLAVAVGVSLLFGRLALKSQSIVGIAVAHALAAVMLFVLLPRFGPAELAWLGAAGTASALIAGSILYRDDSSHEPARSAPPC